MKLKPVLFSHLAVIGLAALAQADVDIGISADIRIGRAMPPPPPEVVVVEQVGPPGPPPWAASHWYRRSYTYYYYPGGNVYYRPDTRVWFYLDGGAWHANARLPDTVRIDFGRSVPLSLETDRPYVYHEQVAAYYPSNYFSRVRFKPDHDGRPGDHHDHRDDHDGNDRGKGHGKGKDKDR